MRLRGQSERIIMTLYELFQESADKKVRWWGGRGNLTQHERGCYRKNKGAILE
jgi:hypothetical protein